ncbi:MAG TPA: RdgB/HAM1 family non-canonical purine NTP pyrophosphatase [Caldilineae bacterium]|nr:RdgB/HAM1 family non-canonical purine NTP pyrophosphatase [Caldilineae bacterium]
MTIKLLVATRNPGKVEEYRTLLADLPVEITWLEAEGITLDVEETGISFEDNALIKALTYARVSGLLTWADDSGLEVDALGGWPGIASARHAGPDATDAERTQILLRRLQGVPYERRTAVFRCVVALATPDGQTWTASGASSGVITESPQGEGGFGYDPVFYIPKYGRTYAQLDPAEKNDLSHRGRAARKAKILLERYLKSVGSGDQ